MTRHLCLRHYSGRKCFVGSLMFLAISVLAVAYTIWDASCVTTRFPEHVQTKATTRAGLLN